MVTSYVGTAYDNILLKERSKGREDEEEFSSYCVKLGNERYWKLKEEAPDHASWRTLFGKGCGLVLRELLVDSDLLNVDVRSSHA